MRQNAPLFLLVYSHWPKPTKTSHYPRVGNTSFNKAVGTKQSCRESSPIKSTKPIQPATQSVGLNLMVGLNRFNFQVSPLYILGEKG